MLSVSNETPDVFALQDAGFAEFVKQNKLMDLTEALKTPAYDQKVPWGQMIQPSLMENVSAYLPPEIGKGKNFGVPFGAISVAAVYNKNIFSKVGIEAPKTWEQFLSNNDKLKAAGYIPLSFTGKVWGDWWLRIAVDQTMRDVKPEDFYSGKVKFTDPRYVEALNTVQDMWKRGHFDPGGFTQLLR